MWVNIIREKIASLSKSNIEAIGASLSVEIASRLGKEGVLIYPGEKTITKAIIEAKELTAEIPKEREQSYFIRAIIELSPIGIILANEEGKIITYNSAAEKVVGIPAHKAKGDYASNVIPQCKLDEIIKEGEKVGLFETAK